MYKISDVTIAGGGIYGCLAAISAAREGARVTLIEPGTFLGNEITAKLRPWINLKGYENINEDVKSIFLNGKSCSCENGVSKAEVPLLIGQIKKNLLKSLLENHITVLFMSEIVGVIAKGKSAAGVLIGTKNGLKVIWTKTIIDATENRRTARFCGADLKVYSKKIIVRRSIEYFKVTNPDSLHMCIPEELGIYENIIELHQGANKKDQYFVEFAMQFDISDGTFSEQLHMEIEARHKTMLLAEYLKNTYTFKDAFLMQTSAQLYMPQIFNFESASYTGSNSIELENCSNLFVFRKKGLLSSKPDCDELMEAYNIAKDIGKTAAIKSLKQEEPVVNGNYMILTGNAENILDTSLLKEDEHEKLGITLFSFDVSRVRNIPETGSYDIVVGGGGTSGAPAAIASASMGAKVALIENFYGLGGTKTVGGVKAYYHGYRGGFNTIIDQQVVSIGQKITTNADYTHIESKMMAYMYDMKNSNISVYLGTKAVGTVMQDNYIKGIIIANSDGLSMINCKIVVDATGDGDIAALAGAYYSYGAPRDGIVQTFNHNGYVKGTFLDLGVIDTRRMTDVVRGICVGHEMGDSYDFCPLLTVRESRRIEGDYELNIADILMENKFQDVISIAMTDCDPHGINASWIARLGYLPLRTGEKPTSIPYRICLPKGIEGLLITAK
ncbi:MAG: hypothetical protein K0S75_3101, partial [Clostridia bacterium]|nr:hypothetical protein [Clostridia bacterium]